MSDEARKLIDEALASLLSPDRRAAIQAEVRRLFERCMADLNPEEPRYFLEKLTEHFKERFGFWPCARTDVLERVARALAVADGKDPDARGRRNIWQAIRQSRGSGEVSRWGRLSERCCHTTCGL